MTAQPATAEATKLESMERARRRNLIIQYILMVLLAKWLLEHDPNGRVLIITDRDELDKQIEGVMKNAGVISADSAS